MADLARHWDPGTRAFASRGALPNSHPFPKVRAQRQAPELGADSGHDLVVAMDKQGAESPKPVPSQPPLRRQP